MAWSRCLNQSLVLVALHLIGRLKKRVPHAPGENEIGSNAPGILEVKLAFVAPEIAFNHFSRSVKVTVLVLVVELVCFRKQACECCRGEVIIGCERGVDQRVQWVASNGINSTRRVQTATGVSNAGVIQPVHVR
jgi:hypothetical protein